TQRRYEVRSAVRNSARVGLEMEWQDHAEGYREGLDPEVRSPGIDLAPRHQAQVLKNRDEGSEPDREGRKQKYARPQSRRIEVSIGGEDHRPFLSLPRLHPESH